jgi:hypothetical protein
LVQRELERLGWAEAAGAIGMGIGTGAILPPGMDSVMTALGLSEQLQRAVVEASPIDLRMSNRKLLVEAGIPADQAEALLLHAWFSPVHESALTEALVALGPRCDRAAILQLALQTRTRREAAQLCRAAARLAHYHKSDVRLVRCFTAGRGLIAVDSRDRIVYACTWDFPLWTHSNARELVEIRDAGRQRGQGPLIVLAESKGSLRFQAECHARGIETRQ